VNYLERLLQSTVYRVVICRNDNGPFCATLERESFGGWKKVDSVVAESFDAAIRDLDGLVECDYTTETKA
jgi:hypothetical protein